MSKERELLQRALENWDASHCDPIRTDGLMEEIRAHLATEEGKQEEEPVYLFRRKGLDDFVTCSKERFDELSELSLFETKIIYPSCPQNKETATRSEDVVTEATDQESDEDWDPPSFYELGKVRHTYTMVKQRKPLSEEEIGYYLEVDEDQDYTDFEMGFTRGVRWAEKMHKIGGGDD